MAAHAGLLGEAAAIAAQAFHWPSRPVVLSGADLVALGTLGGLGFTVAYYGSVMVLIVLQVVVTCLGARLLVRHDRATVVVAVLATFAMSISSEVQGLGWVVAIVSSLAWPLLIVGSLFRFGLLTALVSVFVFFTLGSTPPPFDPSVWYGARGLVYFAMISAIACFSAWTALAGQPLFADVLQEKRSPGA